MTNVANKVNELLDIREDLKENNEKMKIKRDREKVLRSEILDIMRADGAPDIQADGFVLSRKTTKSKVKMEPNFLRTCLGEFTERRALSTENQTDLAGFLDYIETSQKEKGESKETLNIRKGEITRKRKRESPAGPTSSASASAGAAPADPKPKKRKAAF